MEYAIMVPHGVGSLPCLERCRTLKTQKNPCHALRPLKSNRTAVREGQERLASISALSHAIAITARRHPLYCRPSRTARRPPSSSAGPARSSSGLHARRAASVSASDALVPLIVPQLAFHTVGAKYPALYRRVSVPL